MTDSKFVDPNTGKEMYFDEWYDTRRVHVLDGKKSCIEANVLLAEGSKELQVRALFCPSIPAGFEKVHLRFVVEHKICLDVPLVTLDVFTRELAMPIHICRPKQAQLEILNWPADQHATKLDLHVYGIHKYQVN